MKLSALAATGLTMTRLPVMAGPFADVNEYLKTIPIDKRLDPAWVRSLFERGQKETYTDPQALAHIGMPVGGFFAGTVYLGGDGRLWLWDIFNKDQEGIDPRESDIPHKLRGKDVTLTTRSGLNYIQPVTPRSPFKQGFTLRVGGKERSLDHTGFSKITFEGRYPTGKVSYKDDTCPVEVELTAFSPFIPLNLDDSSLPATMMNYTLRNTSSKPLEVALEGYLENPVCLETNTEVTGRRINRVIRAEDFCAIECIAEPESGDADKLGEQRDFGSMSLVLLGAEKDDFASAQHGDTKPIAEGNLKDSVIGSVARSLTINAGEEVTVAFAITWHFPNFSCVSGARGKPREKTGHYYAARFESALVVAEYISKNYARLAGDTQKWVETWYDSTLPYWLLDRSLATTTTLATTTCYRFKNGRFWAWEGVGCCQGTCTHVWHYAQAPGRLFPEVERMTRENVDFGMAMHADGGIGMRAGLNSANNPAHDGQAGRILGVLREHQMSADDAFLRRIWPNVRKALLFLINTDGNGDGILEGAQTNTLDAAWYGKISFVTSLYLAALRAGEQMATEVGDTDFAKRCKRIADRGAKNFSEMFDGEYFMQIADPDHADALGSGTGCYIDQVFGQTWAHWVGLGCLFDRDQQLSALRALWKYNFLPDVGPFRKKFTLGRWYAMAGDAGLLMCTWPKGGNDEGMKENWQYMYFNECMSGFEHQAAAHMVWEGHDQPDILQNGLSIERAIHDRYNASMRNPYNEVECSDHYSRAMASYGVYQAACGYEYNGPQGRLAFAPRLTPEDFRCAFTAAEGWGTFSQKIADGVMTCGLSVNWGSVSLQTFRLDPQAVDLKQVAVKCDGKRIDAKLVSNENSVYIEFETPVRIAVGQHLEVVLR